MVRYSFLVGLLHPQHHAGFGRRFRTVLRRSSYCLCVAVELQRWPSDRSFDEDDVEQLAMEWA
jgi:hypothetical protein